MVNSKIIKSFVFSLALFAIITCSDGFLDESVEMDIMNTESSGMSTIESYPGTEATYYYSFEYGMQGWVADGTDLEIGDGEIDWSITRTREEQYHGNYSLKYYLDNINDAGKIWIEKPFRVRPYGNYEVTVSYRFGSQDYGPINLWTIITGVFSD